MSVGQRESTAAGISKWLASRRAAYRSPGSIQSGAWPARSATDAERIACRRITWTYGSLALGIAVSSAGYVGWSWRVAREVEKAFYELAVGGRQALLNVEIQPSEGRLHLSGPGRFVFRADPPTSGTHASGWAATRMYIKPLPLQLVVHALEHGDVVLYYDVLAERDRTLIKAWIDHISDSQGGVLAVPRSDLGEKVLLTAWTAALRLKEFEPESVAAFIDRYRGRGPGSPGHR